MTLTVYGQKQLLDGDNSRFFCVSDSINHFAVTGLVDNGIKPIMTFNYDYNNGRVPDAVQYVLWLDNEVGHMKIITGCDKITIKDTTFSTEIHNLFDYYKLNRIDTITRELEPPKIRMSHDMGYYITVYLPEKKEHYYIRDYERACNLKDPRVLWVNMFEKIVRCFSD
jgi:hypothetical protein